MRRFPCLATGTPAAAVTSAAAVLMLKVSAPSPPVPQVSISPSRDERMGVMFRRMAAAAPATSSAVSPLSLNPVSSRPISPSLQRGFDLRPRLPLYPSHLETNEFVDPSLRPRVDELQLVVDAMEILCSATQRPGKDLPNEWGSGPNGGGD